jgi:hypothetical protein
MSYNLAGEVSLNRNTAFTSVICMAQKLEKLGLVYYDNEVHYLVAEEVGNV